MSTAEKFSLIGGLIFFIFSAGMSYKQLSSTTNDLEELSLKVEGLGKIYQSKFEGVKDTLNLFDKRIFGIEKDVEQLKKVK